MVLTDFSTFTPDALARLKTLARLPDAEVARLAWAGDWVAWIEFQARWEIRRNLWLKYRVGAQPPEVCPTPPRLRAVLEARRRARAPRTRKHSPYLSLAGRARGAFSREDL